MTCSMTCSVSLHVPIGRKIKHRKLRILLSQSQDGCQRHTSNRVDVLLWGKTWGYQLVALASGRGHRVALEDGRGYGVALEDGGDCQVALEDGRGCQVALEDGRGCQVVAVKREWKEVVAHWEMEPAVSRREVAYGFGPEGAPFHVTCA